MIILGIDPGTATTGYGLVAEDEAGEARLVRYGVITTRPGAHARAAAGDPPRAVRR